MEEERIGADRIHKKRAVPRSYAVVELDRAHVCKEKDVRRDIPDLEVADGIIVLERDPLRAHAHAQSEVLGQRGEAPVQTASRGRAARHRGDDDRS